MTDTDMNSDLTLRMTFLSSACRRLAFSRERAWGVMCVFMLIALTGCQSVVTPDLARLYQFEQSVGQPVPLIVIHGAFGSRLVDAEGSEVWPGGLKRLLWSDYQDIALGINPDKLRPEPDAIRPDGVTDQVAGRDYYGRIIDVLESVGGYEKGIAGAAADPTRRRYYVFAYDWRQDNVVTAAKLHALLDQVRADYGDPELKFDVVAHSMGGLVTRYFARYGSSDVLDDNDFPVSGEGADYLRRVALLGTPNLGSIAALVNMVRGMKVGFDRIPPEVLMTFPSAYQLLPHPLNEWVYLANGKVLQRDLFDIEVWRALQFSIFDPVVEARLASREGGQASGATSASALALRKAYFHKQIERGRRFVWSLTVPADNVELRYVLFGGDCFATANRLVIEDLDGVSYVRFSPQEIAEPVPGIDYQRIMFEPGDGTVTKASLLARQDTDPSVARHPYSYFPLKYPVFLCEQHTQLTGNISFQDNLMHFLLSEDEF